MTTLEKIENIDKLMEQYQVGDVYSLIEKMQENQKTEQEEALASRCDYLEKLYADLKISAFINEIDFDTIKVNVQNDLQTNKPRIVISFYIKSEDRK